MLSSDMKKDTNKTLNNYKNRKYIMAANGIAAGAVAGLIASLYRLLLGKAESTSAFLIAYFSENTAKKILWIVILIAIAFVVSRLIKFESNIKGSGIPQIEAELEGKLDENWLRVIIAKMTGGALCVLSGLSLGREGPSIQLGAMGAKGYSLIGKRTEYEKRYLLTCGASAGLAAAFNAPLAGVMFALEEVHKHFSAALVLGAMAASVTADFISKEIFGLSPVFDFELTSAIPLKYYLLVILLGLLLGLLGAFYNKCIPFLQNVFDNIKFLPSHCKIIVAFLLAGILAFTCPMVLGSGHKMIELLNTGDFTLKSVLILLCLKFAISQISFASGAPGGIFFPLLVLGAYIGCAYALLTTRVFGIEESLINNFIILAMAGYFAAIVRAPLTGIILITEMTGSFQNLLALTAVSLFAYIVADVLKVKPVYEQLLERLTDRASDAKNDVYTHKKSMSKKTILEFTVEPGSAFENKKIKELGIPKNCLLMAVRRGGEELIPSGDTSLSASDMLVTWTSKAHEESVVKFFNDGCRDKH